MNTNFLKIQFGNCVKKIQLHREKILWKNLCQLLQQSFHLADINEIKLNYKDSDGDNITVKNDDDLQEFIALSQKNQGIRLNLMYTGKTFLESGKALAQSQNNLLLPKSLILDESNVENKQASEAKEVLITFEDLEPFFQELFSSAETKKKLLDALSKNPAFSTSESSANFKINIDKAVIADYVLGKVSEIVKQRVSKEQENPVSCPELALDKIESYKSGQKTPNQLLADAAPFRSIRETKLAESVYEPISRPSIEETKKELKNESLSSSKSLTDSCGFHFVMKYEGGRPRFVPVPINPQDLEKKSTELNGSDPKEKEIEENKLKISSTENRNPSLRKSTM